MRMRVAPKPEKLHVKTFGSTIVCKLHVFKVLRLILVFRVAP